MYQSKDEVALEYAEQCNAITGPVRFSRRGVLLLLVVISDARRILT
jgi:hypothetical protein